jgi:adenosylhomocysteine nucleosidase
MRQPAVAPRRENRAVTAPVALFAALREERELLRTWLGAPRRVELDAGYDVETGVVDGIEIVLATTGIGKVAMASRATQVLARFLPRAVLFSGVAGGPDPELRVGDVVVADRLIQHDAGVVRAGGLETHQAGHLPFYDPSDRIGFEPGPTSPEAFARFVEAASANGALVARRLLQVV